MAVWKYYDVSISSRDHDYYFGSFWMILFSATLMQSFIATQGGSG